MIVVREITTAVKPKLMREVTTAPRKLFFTGDPLSPSTIFDTPAF